MQQSPDVVISARAQRSRRIHIFLHVPTFKKTYMCELKKLFSEYRVYRDRYRNTVESFWRHTDQKYIIIENEDEKVFAEMVYVQNTQQCQNPEWLHSGRDFSCSGSCFVAFDNDFQVLFSVQQSADDFDRRTADAEHHSDRGKQGAQRNQIGYRIHCTRPVRASARSGIQRF